jgi:transcription initiation factor TFIID subunit 15
MRFTTILPMLLAAGVALGQNGKGGQNNGQNNGQNGQNNGQNGQNNNNGGGGGGNLALNAANVQKNSNVDGLAQAEAGQAASKT